MLIFLLFSVDFMCQFRGLRFNRMSWTPNEIRAHPLISFYAGGVGGAFLVLSGHPFDTVKVRIQTAPKPKPGEIPLFTGAIDCLRKTVAKEVLVKFGFIYIFSLPSILSPLFTVSKRFRGFSDCTKVWLRL